MLFGLGEYKRMQDVFEPPLFGGIAKNEFAHSVAIKRALSIDEVSAKGVVYSRDCGAAGLGQLVRNEVGVDNARAECGKHIGNGTFAATDASCQSNQIVHRARSCR